MSIIAKWVSDLGGFAQKQQLVRLGATDASLTSAIRLGAVRRARNGWYSTADHRAPEFMAVRIGGRLTGLSAIRAADGWVLERNGPLHVSVPRNAARLRSPRNRRVALTARYKHGVMVHWDDANIRDAGSATAVGLQDALVRVISDEDAVTAVAALDWALHTRRIELSDLDRMLARLPERYRYLRDWVDPACESLPESLSRTRLRLLGHHVSSQAALRTAERVDLVIDGAVGLETDGEEFHWDRFLADRLKDIQILREGLIPVRLPAKVVFHNWPLAVAAVRAALALRATFGNSGSCGDACSAGPAAPPCLRGERPTLARGS
ncbi:glycyl-tRNA synthetase [Salinibacterium sp. dk2585]|uniref:glycyl-tRNA synthetase n=1 Tax=unclassified Salinibacterium TaxID=2632331 RepID=UPI0011C244B6|nr:MULTISPECIES: glycyl-tRNA synthetase [unclassified Salinibacterium]QEE61383.1 glycyl-tRNA synthetase [Salinibacterium sp. dk2585]TXK54060.1 glycyl-tRNA synthetase [Salinibacterium sp. dk5596]